MMIAAPGLALTACKEHTVTAVLMIFELSDDALTPHTLAAPRHARTSIGSQVHA